MELHVAGAMDDIVIVDRISNLPWEILDNILGRLPTKDAVSTTFLSMEWRDKWIDLSKLVFENTHAQIVYHVMLSHRGTINKFIFTTQSCISAYHLEAWISFLHRCDIKDLTLDFSSKLWLPSCLFSLNLLRHLCLTNCWAIMPETFKGFSNLVSLELNNFNAQDKGIESMIDGCPFLEKLVISNIFFKSLNISAPNLKHFYLECITDNVELENCPCLTNATFKLTTDRDTYLVQEMAHTKIQLPSWLSHIQNLTLSGEFLKSMASKYVWDGVSIACDHLKFIELDAVDFEQLEELRLALKILSCSSNLRELHIRGFGAFHKDFLEFTESLARVGCCFNQLRIVKIIMSRIRVGERVEVSFIRLILACSPVLEKMHVHSICSEQSDLQFMREMLMCKRASSQLKFTYECTEVSDFYDADLISDFW